MSDQIDRLEPRVASEQKESISAYQKECCAKVGEDMNQSLVAMGGGKSSDASSLGLPQLNIGAEAEGEMSGRRHHHGPLDPWPWELGHKPEFHRPESSGQFQTDTGSANFEAVGNHHGGYYPYQPPVFHRPESSGQFQTNTGSANFEQVGHRHHGGYYPYQPPVFHRPTSSGQFQTNTGHADFRKHA